jgi:hypothetical protein
MHSIIALMRIAGVQCVDKIRLRAQFAGVTD